LFPIHLSPTDGDSPLTNELATGLLFKQERLI
jgi:hypothetical protein